MKTKMVALCAILSAGLFAETNAVVATTLFSDGRTNTWTQADLVAALQLLNRKYHRDCESPSGRAAWHGKMRESVVTNGTELVKTETHEDGKVFVFRSRRRPPAVAVSNFNARLRTTMSKGVPRALAEARARRQAEKAATNVVTVAVEANKPPSQEQ